MKKNIRLHIASPCHENWNAFTPTQQGAFCGSCQKEVIDFTTWNEDRIKAYFKNKPANTCGRFYQTQLKTYTYAQPDRFPHWVPAIAIGVFSLINFRQGLAQQTLKTKAPIAQFQSEQKIIGDTVIVAKPQIITVNGAVTSREDGLPLPGVNVVRKGIKQTTVTNENGFFSIDLNKPTSSDSLVFSFIGFKTIAREIDINAAENSMNVSLELDQAALEEVIVVGGLVGYRWYNPKRWWWGVRGWLVR